MSPSYNYDTSLEALRTRIERIADTIAQRFQRTPGNEQFSFFDDIVHAVEDIGNNVVNATNDVVNNVVNATQQAVNATAQATDWAVDHTQEVVEVTHGVVEVTEIATEVAEAGAAFEGLDKAAGGAGSTQASAAQLITARRASLEKNRRAFRDRIQSVRSQIQQSIADARSKRG
jgi:hypothetical protein